MTLILILIEDIIMKRLLILLIIILFFPTSTLAKNNWVVKNKENGMRVSTNGQITVDVCHEGSTLNVNWNGWIHGHKEHGDSIGSCGNDSFQQFLSNDGVCYEQLTNNDIDDVNPQLNDNGMVVWQGDYQIYLYDGSEFKKLTDDSYYHMTPQINNNGFIAWSTNGITSHVTVYDGVSIKAIPNAGRSGVYPVQLNNKGEMVWTGPNNDIPGYSSNGVYFYDGSKIEQIAKGSCNSSTPTLSQNGEVTWTAPIDKDCSGNSWEVFLNNGSITRQLTHNTFMDRSPKINSKGHVIWGSGDSGKLYFYDGVTVNEFTDISGGKRGRYDINSSGSIAWILRDNKMYLLLRGLETTLISDNANDKMNLRMDENNNLSWIEQINGQWQVMYYDGSVKQISGLDIKVILGSYTSMDIISVLSISNNQVAWYAHDGNDYEIYRTCVEIKKAKVR